MSLDTEMAEQLVKLNEENKFLKKALELASEKIQYYAFWDPDIPNNQSKIQEDLIKQAKENLK